MMGADNEKRYAHGDVECIDAIRSALTSEEFRGFCKGNVIQAEGGWLMSDEDSLRHKYAPLPEEPRYKKKTKKKHVRSDHKHVYERVCIDAHSFIYRRGEIVPYLYLGKRCKVCGRLYDWERTNVSEPPDGMPLYEIPNWSFLWDEKALPSELEVGNAGKEDA